MRTKNEFADKSVTTYLLHRECFPPVQTTLFPPPSTALLLAADPNDDISRLPIGTLIRLTLEHDLMAFRHSLRHLQGIMLRVVHHLVPMAVRALLANRCPAPAALIARNLGLGEHAGHDLLAHDSNALAAARVTFMDVVGRSGTSTAAVVAKDSLLDHKVDARASVDVREGDLELANGRGTLAHLMTSMTTAKEALEHVEGVCVWLLATLVCLQAFFTMAVVDLPFSRVGQDLICCKSLSNELRAAQN